MSLVPAALIVAVITFTVIVATVMTIAIIFDTKMSRPWKVVCAVMMLSSPIVFSWAIPEIWMVPIPDYSISFS